MTAEGRAGLFQLSSVLERNTGKIQGLVSTMLSTDAERTDQRMHPIISCNHTVETLALMICLALIDF